MDSQNETGFSYEINSKGFAPESVNIGALSMYADSGAVRAYVRDPMYYHNEICDICESLYNASGILTEVISKMVAAPTFDYVAIPPSGEAVDLKGEAESVIETLSIPMFVRDALRSYLLYGDYVKILQARKVNGREKIMFKPLHHKYVRFDGTAAGDHIVSFDLNYFDAESSPNTPRRKSYPQAPPTREADRAVQAYPRGVLRRTSFLAAKQASVYSCPLCKPNNPYRNNRGTSLVNPPLRIRYLPCLNGTN